MRDVAVYSGGIQPIHLAIFILLRSEDSDKTRIRLRGGASPWDLLGGIVFADGCSFAASRCPSNSFAHRLLPYFLSHALAVRNPGGSSSPCCTCVPSSWRSVARRSSSSLESSIPLVAGSRRLATLGNPKAVTKHRIRSSQGQDHNRRRAE